MSTTTNFFEALKNYKPIKQKKIFYRLYYDKHGEVIKYSMEELEGDYINISCSDFAKASKDVYVKDGQIHKKIKSTIGKLVPVHGGTPDITIADPTKWKMKTYD